MSMIPSTNCRLGLGSERRVKEEEQEQEQEEREEITS
jgi:hypothetical protein